MPLGLDIITDGIGAIYAGYYYDIETASYYGAGIVVAGVSGAVFRQLATRSKKISRVSGEFKIVDNVVHQSDGNLSKTNLLNVTWKNNIVGHLSGDDALKLWNNTSKEFAHLVDGDFYLKFDKQTGNLLFGNHNTGEILGFYEGIRNIEIINNKELGDILGKLKIYHGVSGSPSYIVTSNLSSGARIISNPEKTTTIIGNYMRYDGYSGDMKAIVGDELLGDLKTQQFGAKKGGFNILNVSDEAIAANGNWVKFWDNFNKPWLEEAIRRGDDIWAASDPMDLSLLFKRLNNVPVEDIKSPTDLANFLKNLDDFEILDEITGFGNEIKLLSENDYIYNSTTKMFIK